MTREREIEILMMDGCTRADAEKHLKKGAIIHDEDLEENFDNYMDEWDIDEDDREKYKAMIDEKIPVLDWGIVEDAGKTYYIMYVL